MADGSTRTPGSKLHVEHTHTASQYPSQHGFGCCLSAPLVCKMRTARSSCEIPALRGRGVALLFQTYYLRAVLMQVMRQSNTAVYRDEFSNLVGDAFGRSPLKVS